MAPLRPVVTAPDGTERAANQYPLPRQSVVESTGERTVSAERKRDGSPTVHLRAPRPGLMGADQGEGDPAINRASGWGYEVIKRTCRPPTCEQHGSGTQSTGRRVRQATRAAATATSGPGQAPPRPCCDGE